MVPQESKHFFQVVYIQRSSDQTAPDIQDIFFFDKQDFCNRIYMEPPYILMEPS